MHSFSSLLISAALASVAVAKTDLTGCTTTDMSSPAGASVAWYVPGTGEICAPLDCGGGRAPPKYTVPGCPLYTGTATYSPSYLSNYNADTTAAPSTSMTDTSAPNWTTSAAWSSVMTESWSSSTTSSITGMAVYNTTTTISAMSTGATTTVQTTVQAINSVSANGTATMSTTGKVGNATSPSATASKSPATATGGAAKNARLWISGAGMAMGVGAVIVAL